MQASDAAKALAPLEGFTPNTAKTSKELWPVVRPSLLFIAKSAGSGDELRYALLEFVQLTEQEYSADETVSEPAVPPTKINGKKK
jgi:hypothetical protein